MAEEKKEITPEAALKTAEKTIAELTRSNSALVDVNSTQKDNIASLMGELSTANSDLAGKKTEVDVLTEKVETLESEATEAEEVIAGLEEANAEAPIVVKGDAVIVSHNKAKYRVIGMKLVYKKDRKTAAVEIAAEDLNDHPEVVADLIKRESGVLVKIEKE